MSDRGPGAADPGVELMGHRQVGPRVLGLSDSSWVCSLNSMSAAWAVLMVCPILGFVHERTRAVNGLCGFDPPAGLSLIGVSASLYSQLFTTLFWYHPFLFGEKMGNLRRLSSF